MTEESTLGGTGKATGNGGSGSALPYYAALLLLAIASPLFDYILFPSFSPRNPGVAVRRILGSAATGFAFFALIVGTAQLLRFRAARFRIPVIIYHFIAVGTLLGFFLIQERLPLEVDVGVIMDGLGILQFLPVETFRFFWKQILLALAITAVLVFLLDMLGKRLSRLRRVPVSPFLSIFLYVAGFSVFLLPAYAGQAVHAPVFARVPVMTAAWLIRDNFIYRGQRAKPLSLACRSEKTARHIIFVMDESVGGKYLGVNGYPRPTTPFLESRRNDFYNYGECCSSANLSQTSNLIFMSGLRLDQIPDRDQASLRQASLFGYARQAGRDTYYVDAQQASKYDLVLPRDHADFTMRTEDVSEIHLRDMTAIATVKDILANAERPTYIFLLKMGCHFAYDNKYPPGAYPEGLEKSGFVPESYHKAVRWNVDEFFARLTAELEGMEVLLVYTSDHGQHFNENQTGMHATTADSHPDQANVPLIVWPMNDAARRAYESCGGFRPEQFGRAWHFQLFPSMLRLMGYDGDEVAARFGPDLFHAAPGKRVFVSGELINEFGNHSAQTFFNDFDAGE